MADAKEADRVMQYCFDTALDHDALPEIKEPLVKYLEIMRLYKDLVTTYKNELFLNRILLNTTVFDKEIAAYYRLISEDYREEYEKEDSFLNAMGWAEAAIVADILSGNLQTAISGTVKGMDPQVLETLMENGLSLYRDLFTGNPSAAADSYNRFSYTEELGSYSSLQQLAGYVKRGYISKEDWSVYVRSLRGTPSFVIKQLTSDNIKDGLLLGDIVLAVNDLYVGVPSILHWYEEEYPSARLLVLRDKRYVEIQCQGEWKLAGGFREDGFD